MAGFVWYGSKQEILVRVYNEALETALAWNGRPHESDDLVFPGQRQAIGAPEQPHRGAPPPGHLLSAPESQQLRLAQVVHWYQICTEEICSKRLILRHLLHINRAQNNSIEARHLLDTFPVFQDISSCIVPGGTPAPDLHDHCIAGLDL